MNEQRVCVGQMPPIPGADVDAISDGAAAWTILVLGRRQQLQEPRYDTVLPILAGAVSRMSNQPIPSPSRWHCALSYFRHRRSRAHLPSKGKSSGRTMGWWQIRSGYESTISAGHQVMGSPHLAAFVRSGRADRSFTSHSAYSRGLELLD